MKGSTLYAGWKNLACDDEWYVEVRWAHPSFGRMFMDLWRVYLRQRSSLEKKIGSFPHPYAWVNISDGELGAPYKVGRYVEAFESAVQRIGLIPDKKRGTTPHGCRHNYAWRLEEAGVSPITIKNCLHHNALDSQLVYTKATRDKIDKELNAGVKRMNDKITLQLSEGIKTFSLT